MSGRTVRRVARRGRAASCGHAVPAGAVYLVHTAFPGGDDAGYASTAGHPVQLDECGDCATRYGRADLLVAP